MECTGCGYRGPEEGPICHYCGMKTLSDSPAPGAAGAQGFSLGQTVFAQWSSDGYYYPATVGDILENHVRVSFLDGDAGTVSKAHIVELGEAFKVMEFEGNWKYLGMFYKGVISSSQPLIMDYDDGDVERIQLNQLRGSRLR